MRKIIFKGEKKKETVLHSYEVGRFGGGTQPPVYLNSEGEKVPFNKTKWYQKKLRNIIKNGSNKG